MYSFIHYYLRMLLTDVFLCLSVIVGKIKSGVYSSLGLARYVMAQYASEQDGKVRFSHSKDWLPKDSDYRWKFLMMYCDVVRIRSNMYVALLS